MELRGKRVICKHLKRSWKTVVALKDKGLPVALVGGVWISDSEAVRQWTMRQLQRRSD